LDERKDSYLTAEDIAANLDKIEHRSKFIVPSSIHDELREIADQIARRDGVPWAAPAQN
jgi:hypothetical protein